MRDSTSKLDVRGETAILEQQHYYIGIIYYIQLNSWGFDYYYIIIIIQKCCKANTFKIYKVIVSIMVDMAG